MLVVILLIGELLQDVAVAGALALMAQDGLLLSIQLLTLFRHVPR